MIFIFNKIISLTQLISIVKPHQYLDIHEKITQLSVWKYFAPLSPYIYNFNFSH